MTKKLEYIVSKSHYLSFMLEMESKGMNIDDLYSFLKEYKSNNELYLEYSPDLESWCHCSMKNGTNLTNGNCECIGQKCNINKYTPRKEKLKRLIYG